MQKRLDDPSLLKPQKLLIKGAPFENKPQWDSGLVSIRFISKDRVTFTTNVKKPLCAQRQALEMSESSNCGKNSLWDKCMSLRSVTYFGLHSPYIVGQFGSRFFIQDNHLLASAMSMNQIWQTMQEMCSSNDKFVYFYGENNNNKKHIKLCECTCNDKTEKHLKLQANKVNAFWDTGLPSVSVGLQYETRLLERSIVNRTKLVFLHVLFQFLCNLQQYCDSAYNKLAISKHNS